MSPKLLAALELVVLVLVAGGAYTQVAGLGDRFGNIIRKPCQAQPCTYPVLAVRELRLCEQWQSPCSAQPTKAPRALRTKAYPPWSC